MSPCSEPNGTETRYEAESTESVISVTPPLFIVRSVDWVFPENCRATGSIPAVPTSENGDADVATSTVSAPAIPLEAYGLAVDAYARATIGMSSIFLGPALLQLAATAAGCPSSFTDNDANTNDDESVYEECTKTIHGFRPSSLLTNLAALSGVLGCIALPLIGSMVDHTPYRKQLGVITAGALVITKGMELMISSRTWEIVASLQILSALLFYSHITASYAYISELSPVPTIQASYNTTFFMILYASTLFFMIQVMTVSTLWNRTVSGNSMSERLDDVGTARVSQTLTVLTCVPCFAAAWTMLFRNRPPASRVPPGMTVVSAGYRQLYHTSRKLTAQFPALTMLLCAISLSEAASGALIAVSTTYMKNVLRMNANEIGVVFMAVLLSGFPGSKLGCWLTTRLGNPVESVMICNVFFIFSTSLAAWVLRGPDDKHLAVIFGVLWGSALGWLQPQHTTAYVPIIPRGQEAELMGLFLLSGQFLSWLPPTVFTLLNEWHVPMSYGLGSLSVFFLAGLLCLLRMGSYEDAMAAASTAQFQHQHRYDSDGTDSNHSNGYCDDNQHASQELSATSLTTSKRQEHYPLHGKEFS